MEEKNKKEFVKFLEGELFDLTLYQTLLKIETDQSLRNVLNELIGIEKKHLSFWQEITRISQPKLSFPSKIKLKFFSVCRKIFGPSATVLILEMIEIYGANKYIPVWEKYKETQFGQRIKEILKEEFEHEDMAISQRIERKVNVEKIKSAILGFNDGFVEIFGALGGFLAAFGNYLLVGFAGLIVGLAGSISMGASAFLAAKSEKEIKETEEKKREILKEIDFERREKETIEEKESPLSSAFYVGIFYFFGALLPVSPFLLGAENIIFSILIGFFLLLFLSFLTAFFAGENFLSRLKLNLGIIVGAILITYFLSYLAKIAFRIEI